jgi:hypothetical protein
LTRRKIVIVSMNSKHRLEFGNEIPKNSTQEPIRSEFESGSGSVVTPTRKSFIGSRPGKSRMDARKQQLMRISCKALTRKVSKPMPSGRKTSAVFRSALREIDSLSQKN